MIAAPSSRKAYSEDQEYSPHIGAGDIHSAVKHHEVADPVMWSKLTKILAAGDPALPRSIRVTATSEVLYGYGCGIMVLPQSVAELASGIITLVGDARMHQRLGRNARRYAGSYLDLMTAGCGDIDPCTPCICERLSTPSDEGYAPIMLRGSTTLKTAVVG